jgi:DNA polymerase epsilon subunit 1
MFDGKVSQQMRTLLLLGTSCSVDDGSGMTLNRARDVGFDLKQLAYSAPSSTRKYLSSIKNADPIFIFHSTSAPRHVFAIFFANKTVKIHIVDNAKVRQPLPRLNETYAGLIKEYQKNPASKWSVIEYPDRLDFETSHHSTDAIALKAISREIGVRENGFALVTISSPKDQAYFESGIQKLSKFPVLMVPASKRSHSLDAFPWQPDVVKKMITRYLRIGSWLKERIEYSAYHNVPAGNVEGDEALFYADVDFARRLWKRDAILWWSPGPRPDLGGQEDDEGEGEELSNIQLSSPGSYANVCLSIEVKDLAFNAVMQSSFVNEMEGSGGATAFDSTSHTLDDYSKGEANVSVTLGDSILSPGVFAELKALVRSWHSDKALSPVPRMSIEHFGRWISSKSSLMYDPGIHRFIHGLMRKTFIQMIAEFKRLGSNVIYADFGNIVLLTSKPPGTASAYATYLLTAVTSHDLFRHIHLRTDRYYDYLLFMDKANQGGVVCMDPMAVEPPTKTSSPFCHLSRSRISRRRSDTSSRLGIISTGNTLMYRALLIASCSFLKGILRRFRMTKEPRKLKPFVNSSQRHLCGRCYMSSPISWMNTRMRCIRQRCLPNSSSLCSPDPISTSIILLLNSSSLCVQRSDAHRSSRSKSDY